MQRKPTTPQKWMIFFFSLAALSLVAFTVIELVGVFSPEGEDTFSEWVFDTNFWLRLVIAIGSVIVGIFAIWSAGHYWEGWGRRKDRKFEDDE